MFCQIRDWIHKSCSHVDCLDFMRGMTLYRRVTWPLSSCECLLFVSVLFHKEVTQSGLTSSIKGWGEMWLCKQAELKLFCSFSWFLSFYGFSLFFSGSGAHLRGYLFIIFIRFLKVTFHLRLSQNIGCVPHVVQYILEPTLHPIVCTSHSPHPYIASYPLLTGNH